MKIHDVLNGIPIIITNEERNFIQHYGGDINVHSLDDHSQVIANNLVRKGVYSISTDRKYISKIDDARKDL